MVAAGSLGFFGGGYVSVTATKTTNDNLLEVDTETIRHTSNENLLESDKSNKLKNGAEKIIFRSVTVSIIDYL